ncbi:MAG: hypothetical protein U1E65_20550 [Myxococcota bacterium]
MTFILCLALVACKDPPKPEVKPSPTPSPRQVEVSPAPLSPSPRTATIAEPETSTLGPSRDSLIASYQKSCSFIPKVMMYSMEGPEETTACEAVAFEQNCSPDFFGCWDKRSACRDGCKKPCTDCQASASGACDKCKAACKDEACTKSCAEARADAYLRCVRAMEDCRDTRCPADEERCMKAGAERVKKVCGATCEAYKSCITSHNEIDQTVYEGCQKKFPKLSEDCQRWCDPGF